jgi:hypothetical protein
MASPDATTSVDGHTGDGAASADSTGSASDGTADAGSEATNDATSDATPTTDGASDATPASDAASDGPPEAGSAPVCGDGVCERHETSQTCPRDCVLSCGSVVVDLSQALMWNVTPSSYVTWPEANTFCKAMTAGGYTDWVLPSYQDYETVLGNCVMDPNLGGGADQCATCAASPACTAMFPGNGGLYWNSTTYGTCCAGGADFFTGTLEIGYYQDGNGTGGLFTRCDRVLTDCSTMPTCLPSEACSPLGHVCLPTACPPATDAGP